MHESNNIDIVKMKRGRAKRKLHITHISDGEMITISKMNGAGSRIGMMLLNEHMITDQGGGGSGARIPAQVIRELWSLGYLKSKDRVKGASAG